MNDVQGIIRLHKPPKNEAFGAHQIMGKGFTSGGGIISVPAEGYLSLKYRFYGAAYEGPLLHILGIGHACLMHV